MTENEAAVIIKKNFPKTCKVVDGRYKGGFDDVDCDFGGALLLAISSLEEVGKYRAIGTAEDCRLYKGISEKEFSTACLDMKIIDELREYKNIGTAGECREAREKQEPMKPREVLLSYGKGCECGNCGNELPINPFTGIYCHWCGQKLDWSTAEQQRA